MRVINEISSITDTLKAYKIKNATIGMVPTMGALHDGHLELIAKAKLECDVVVPKHNVLMGAIGMAILVRDHFIHHETKTLFRGLDVAEIEFVTSAFTCGDCSNNCEIIQVKMPENENEVIARWGSRCGKWEVF